MQTVDSDAEAFRQLDEMVSQYEGALLHLAESWGEAGMLAAVLGRFRRQFDVDAQWPEGVEVRG